MKTVYVVTHIWRGTIDSTTVFDNRDDADECRHNLEIGLNDDESVDMVECRVVPGRENIRQMDE